MNHHGVLTVVSGFSGAGKGTIMKELMGRYDNYSLSISATTRNPRPGEEHGREYFFVTQEEFLDMIDQEQLIEYAQYVNHYYGTPREYVEAKLAEGRDVILEIEIQGAHKVKRLFPDAVLVFVVPPSVEELRRRLLNRGTETPEVIEKRLRRAKEEADGMDSYEYILVNDDLDACVEELHELIRSQHLRMSANKELVERFKKEIKTI